MTDKKRVIKIKQRVIQRDGAVCCFCDKELETSEITMEHIVPESKGGIFNATNLTVSCYKCNNTRGNLFFFSFARRWKFSEEKNAKYRRLYNNNLLIKLLNLSKPLMDGYDLAIPQDLIVLGCNSLRINPDTISFRNFSDPECFNFNALYRRNEIIYYFENLIKLIESRS